MEKYITDERTGLKYELVGDYYNTNIFNCCRHFLMAIMIADITYNCHE